MDKIEKEFNYGGRRCIITITEFGYLCGYTEIRPHEKLYGRNYIDINDDLILPMKLSDAGTSFPVNDGTYWIGFTCDEAGVKPNVDRVKELWGDHAFVLIFLNMQKVSPIPKTGVIRTIEFAEDKLKRLVNGVDVYENRRQST